MAKEGQHLRWSELIGWTVTGVEERPEKGEVVLKIQRGTPPQDGTRFVRVETTRIMVPVVGRREERTRLQLVETSVPDTLTEVGASYVH